MADTDRDLLEQLSEDGAGTLAAFFTEHRERFLQIINFRIHPRLRGRVDADDVLQEAYLAATQRIHHYLQTPSKSFFVWLRLIVAQTLTDVHRHHFESEKRDIRREAVRSIGGHSTCTSLVARLVGRLTSPSQAARREELENQVTDLINQMSEIDREVLALRHFEELTNAEVAEVLDLQPKTASKRYIDAVRRLRAVLTESPEFHAYLADHESLEQSR